MSHRISRVDPLMDNQMCDFNTPPKHSTNMEEHHPHPHDETSDDAGEGNGQESIVMEKGKKKKKWWKMTNFFRSLRKQLKGSSNLVQGEVEQPQESEQVKPQNECKTRCSDDYTVNHNQLDDQLGECGLGAETRRLDDDPEVSVEHLNKTDEDVEGICTLGYPHGLPEDIALDILEKRGPDSHVCDLSTPQKLSTILEEQDSHPHAETPVDAGEGNGQESKVKETKWWRPTSLFGAPKKHRKNSLNPVEGEAELPGEQEQQIEEVKPQKERKARCSDDFILSHYQLGDLLGEGGFGVVYEARRLEDNIKVAVKYVNKTEKYNNKIYLPEYKKILPMEIALMIRANKGPIVPEIIQMLDWKDYRDHYVMILECPSPCETLDNFVYCLGGSLNESLACKIMRQVTRAANMCCQRKVFHRDIKMNNLLINNETHEVKLIDFGCGDILKTTVYETYYGTALYCPPEFFSKGEYHGKPATVWSLGVLLFRMVTGYYPDFLDLHMLKLHLWSKAGLSRKCSQLLRTLLHKRPKERTDLEKILYHNWFSVLNLRSA